MDIQNELLCLILNIVRQAQAAAGRSNQLVFRLFLGWFFNNVFTTAPWVAILNLNLFFTLQQKPAYLQMAPSNLKA